MDVQTITLSRTIQMKERMQALIKAGHHPDQFSMFVAAAEVTSSDRYLQKAAAGFQIYRV